MNVPANFSAIASHATAIRHVPPKGSNTRVTMTIKAAIEAAVQPGGCHPQGLAGWLIERAQGSAVDRQIFAGLIGKLGIGDAIRAKAKTRSGGLIAEFVASGEAEIAVQQIPELKAVAGIDVVGPFPAEVQVYTDMAAATFCNAPHAAAAQAFDASLSASPTLAYAHYQAGLAYNRLNRPDLTVARFETFVRLAPSAPERPQVDTILRAARGRRRQRPRVALQREPFGGERELRVARHVAQAEVAVQVGHRMADNRH